MGERVKKRCRRIRSPLSELDICIIVSTKNLACPVWQYTGNTFPYLIQEIQAGNWWAGRQKYRAGKNRKGLNYIQWNQQLATRWNFSSNFVWFSVTSRKVILLWCIPCERRRPRIKAKHALLPGSRQRFIRLFLVSQLAVSKRRVAKQLLWSWCKYLNVRSFSFVNFGELVCKARPSALIFLQKL